MGSLLKKSREEKPFPVISLTDEDFNQLVKAAGNACVGIGHAISGLARAGDLMGAKELTVTLNHLTKSISWNLKLAMEARTSDGDRDA